MELIRTLESDDEAKIKIITFLNLLRKVGPNERYSLERRQHLDYVAFLVFVEKSLRQKEYEKVVDLLLFEITEDDCIRQPRCYVNLIHILEQFEKE